MTTSTQWQLARDSAERYQTILTAAILGPFAKALVDFAALQTGEQVVDVGCGTGAAARFAAEIVGESGHVTGIDVNTSMLDVARQLPPVRGAPIQWREANATQLPLNEASVDVVLCAQTVQFLPDKEQSLSEMRRVVKPSGRIALSVWCELENNPYFGTLVNAVVEHIGPETAAGLKAAFAFSKAEQIVTLLERVGFENVYMNVAQLDLPLLNLVEFVPRHISATPMAAGFSAAPAVVQRAVVHHVVESLRQYGNNGQVTIPFQSYMLRLEK